MKVNIAVMAALLALAGTAPGQDSTLIAHYYFNGNTRDTSVYGNHGTERNGVALATDRYGNPDNAYHFDGVDDYISAPDAPSLDLTGSVTLCAWIKSDTCPQTSDGDQVVGKGTHLNENYEIGFFGTPSVNLLFLCWIDGAPYVPAVNNWLTPQKVGIWKYISSVYNNANGTVRFYEDGNFILECTGLPNHLSTNNDELQIGANYDYSGTYYDYFKGSIDDIRIYNRALSDAEVLAIYNAEKPPAVEDSSLVAHYLFNGNARDTSGYGNHGTIIEATSTTDRFGQANNAYQFDGVNDYITVPHNPLFNFTNEFTFSFWMKPSTAIQTSDAGLIAKGTGNTEVYCVDLSDVNGDDLRFFCWAGGSPYVLDNLGWLDSSKVDKWCQVIARYRGSTQIGELFINGQLLNSATFPSILDTNAEEIAFGGQRTVIYDKFFNGCLDDIRMYNRALSDAEVLALYNAEKPPDIVDTNLVAHYLFNGNARDTSGYGNHGIPQNGVALTMDRFGQADNAYLFDGIDDYILAPDAPSLDLTTAATISAWIRADQYPQDEAAPIIAKGGNNTDNYRIDISDPSNNNLRFLWWLSGSPNVVQYNNWLTPARVGNWYHIVAVFDGSIGTARLYENGSWLISANGLASTLSTGAESLAIGSHNSFNGLYEQNFKGAIDDIRIYNRALDSSEIRAIYEQERPYTLQPPQLISPPDGWHTNADSVHHYWHPCDSATSYRFQAAQDTGFAAGLMDIPTADTAYSYSTQQMGGWWYWRIKAYKAGMADSSDWSEVRTYCVDTQAPLAPVLKGPPDMAWVSGGPGLSWSASAGADFYRAQVSADTTFGAVSNDTVTADTFRYVPPLPDGKYFWRVAAGDSAGNWSAYGEVRRYRLDTTAPKINWTKPANGATGVHPQDTILIAFSETIGPGFILHDIDPFVALGYAANPRCDTFKLWSTQFALGQAYTLTVTSAPDSAGNALAPGPVPNPFVFTITTDATGPVLRHTPVAAADSGTAVPLTAYATDPGSGVQTVILYYRQGGRDEFTEAAMSHPSDSTYQAQIPASEVTVRGLSYYLRAVDNLGSQSFSPAGAPAVRHQPRVPLANVVYGPTLSGGSYRMFALPFETAGPPWRPSQLADDLGTYDATVWRLFRWQSGAYAEYEAVQDIIPGRAYWIINRNGGTFDLPGGRTVADSAYHIPLASGWNMVGAPFNYPVNLSDVRVYAGPQGFDFLDTANILTERRLVDYDGSGYANKTRMDQWHGYWVRALTGGVTMMVPASSATDKSAPVKYPEGWTLSLEAVCGSYHDRDNRIGITPRGYRDNVSEPPGVGQGLSLAVGNNGKKLAEDYRAEIGPGQCWRFSVDCGLEGPVDLSWREEGERGWQYAVYDADAGRAIEGGSYRFQAGRGARQFAALAGSAEYIASEAYRAGLVPSATLMEKIWPNPFTQLTNINYQLSRPGLARIAVYNVLGQKVRALVNEVQPQGRYQITWDGRDGAGRRAGAGVYFCRFEAGGASSTRRMMLVR